jgi:hypothetical protein
VDAWKTYVWPQGRFKASPKCASTPSRYIQRESGDWGWAAESGAFPDFYLPQRSVESRVSCPWRRDHSCSMAWRDRRDFDRRGPPPDWRDDRRGPPPDYPRGGFDERRLGPPPPAFDRRGPPPLSPGPDFPPGPVVRSGVVAVHKEPAIDRQKVRRQPPCR